MRAIHEEESSESESDSETDLEELIRREARGGWSSSEDEKSVRLMTADGSIVAIATDDVDDRASGKSAMPEDLVKTLSKADIRDLVEYLSTLKTAASTTEHK